MNGTTVGAHVVYGYVTEINISPEPIELGGGGKGYHIVTIQVGKDDLGNPLFCKAPLMIVGSDQQFTFINSIPQVDNDALSSLVSSRVEINFFQRVYSNLDVGAYVVFSIGDPSSRTDELAIGPLVRAVLQDFYLPGGIDAVLSGQGCSALNQAGVAIPFSITFEDRP